MANPSSEIRAEDRDNLHHMLGVGAHIPKRRWGFRNYYACGLADLPSLERLEAAGLVRRGQPYEDGYYFQATEAGCALAGLNARQRREALGWPVTAVLRL